MKYYVSFFSFFVVLLFNSFFVTANTNDNISDKINSSANEFRQNAEPLELLFRAGEILDFNTVSKYYNQHWEQIEPEQRKGYKQYKRWEWFWEQRTFPDGKFPNANEIYKEKINFGKQSDNSMLNAKTWNHLGPFNKPERISNIRSQGLGRVNIIRIHPNNNNELWAGSASGGVWKSTNGGSNWQTFPFLQFLSLGVSDIAIATTNPNVVYVATGDVNGTQGSAMAFYSVGLIKTTNSGASWDFTSLQSELHQGDVIPRVLVFPDNANSLVVATNRGVFKSLDGGKNFKNVLNANIRDMQFKPGDHSVIYAATFGWNEENSIYKSTDFGETWSIVHSVAGALRIALAVTEKNPANVYAVFSHRSTNGFHSYWKSTNDGANWTEYANRSNTPNLLGWYQGTGGDSTGQASYDMCIAVSPLNEHEIYIGGINIWKSTNSGLNWVLNTHWNGNFSKPLVHADMHGFGFQPNSSVLYSANDGGVYRTVNGGQSWTDLTNTMSITQFYRLGMSKTNPNLVIAGSQDNGTSMYKEGTWYHVYSADGMECAVDPVDDNRLYASIYYGNFYRSENGGVSFEAMVNPGRFGESGAWVAPLEICPTNRNVLYAGFNNVYRSNDYGKGTSWTKISNFSGNATLRAIAIAPSDPNTIYAATLSLLYATFNGGQSWEILHTAARAITYIAVDPNNPRRLWITYSGYSENEKVMEYSDGKWNNITGNLPNVPVNTIVYEKDTPDRLWVGTDIGVFYTDYNSNIWNSYNEGLQNVIVNELEIFYGATKNTLRAATYGRGVWEVETLDCNFEPIQVNVIGNTTICSGDSVILEAPAGFDTYIWSNGATTQQVVVKESGTYAVAAGTGYCVPKSKAIDIEVLQSREIFITTNSTSPVCFGEPVELYANIGFTSYLWSNGETERKITVTEPGNYSVLGTLNNGCSSKSEDFFVEMLALPMQPIISREGNQLISTSAESYQWYLDGNPIPGATEQFLQINEIGLYKVKIVDENNCASYSEELEVTTSVSSIVGENDYLTIIPNPGRDDFYFEITLPKAVEYIISITDLLGNELLSFEGTLSDATNRKKVNLSHLSAGVYFVKLSYGDNFLVKKLIKE